jgi:hypothetical protein
MRSFVSSLALPAFLAAAAVACSAAPDASEHTASSTEALVPKCTPFSELTSTGGDGEPIQFSCAPLVSPPDPQPPASSVQACTTKYVDAPPELAAYGCTRGYNFGLVMNAGEVFMCPLSLTPLPAAALYMDDPAYYGCSVAYEWVGPVDNGCFGEPLDPAYGFVHGYLVAGPGCSPGNCGAACPRF